MDIDVERFIFEIEKRPAIWNMRHRGYSTGQKILQWEEIINIFTDQNVSVDEKKSQGQILQKRWKTMRDAFVKERRQFATPKSGSAATNKKQYKYYKQLLFLLPVISTNATHDSMANETEMNLVDNPQCEDENIMMAPEPKKTNKNDPSEKIGTELLNVLKSTVKQKTAEEDPDRHFMLSLVNDFYRISPRKRPAVKINILKCIMEAQDDLYDSHRIQRVGHHQCSNPSYSSEQNEGYYTRPPQQVQSRRPSYQLLTTLIQPNKDCHKTGSQNIQQSLGKVDNINSVDDITFPTYKNTQHEDHTYQISLNTENSSEDEILSLFEN